MTLQVFFGDDEHTAKDGTYSRILRARKWLYLSAAAATLLALQLYRPEAASEIVRVFELPAAPLRSAVLLGLCYLLIQYALLLYQLGITYDIVLSERLSFRRADELSAAADRLQKARQDLARSDASHREEVTQQYRSLDAVRGEALRVERELQERYDILEAMEDAHDDELFQLRSQLDSARAERIRVEQRLREASEQLAGRLDQPNDDRLMLREAVSEAQAALDGLKRQNPADRRGYPMAERLIDLSRVVPPVIIAAAAAVALARTPLGA